ncbi:MAG TPA: hypothetical protein VFB22_14840 [Candidatus Baltobacteraceae bacterium]|nr:hypothetical protein [Candidatus Baltobacteraceae bacterium]
MVVATLIAAMAATALGAATASPYAGDLAERLRAVLAGHAIPVRRVTFVHERAVTTADAQRAVTFPIIVPSGLSVTSTMLLDDPSGGPRSVELAVRNAALTTVLLNESPASDRRSSAIERMAYITHRTQRGALGRPTRLTWRIGATRLTIVTDDAVSRSLAEHVRDITRSQPRRSRE